VRRFLTLPAGIKVIGKGKGREEGEKRQGRSSAPRWSVSAWFVLRCFGTVKRKKKKEKGRGRGKGCQTVIDDWSVTM